MENALLNVIGKELGNINVRNAPASDINNIKTFYARAYALLKTPERLIHEEVECLPYVMSVIGYHCAHNSKCIPDNIIEGGKKLSPKELQANFIRDYFVALSYYKAEIPKISQNFYQETQNKPEAERSWVFGAMMAPTNFAPNNRSPLWSHAADWIIGNPQIWHDKSLIGDKNIMRPGMDLLTTVCEMDDNIKNMFYPEEKMLLCRYNANKKSKLLLVEFRDDGKVKIAIYTDAKNKPNHRIVTDMVNGFDDDRNTDAKDIVEHAMPFIQKSAGQIRNTFN
jgi:hypothetical protein